MCSAQFPEFRIMHILALEEWRTLVRLPRYEVSSHGRVRSKGFMSVRRVTRGGGCGTRTINIPGRTMKTHICKCLGKPNAVRVTLSSESGKRYSTAVSRLILEAFVGPAPDGTECCHGDGNIENNNLENLRWDTHAENMQDSIRHGTAKPPSLGEGHWNAKITLQDARDIKEARRNGIPFKYICNWFDLSLSNVEHIVYGRYWKNA